MASRIGDVPFLDLLPPSISGDPAVQAAGEAADGELARLASDARLCLIYSRIDELVEPALSLLAQQFSADFWDPDASLAAKRATVKKLLLWHRKKGTPWAVEDAAGTAAGTTARVREWFEFSGEPGRFRLRLAVAGAGLSLDTQRKALAAALAMKNVRSHLDGTAVELAGSVTVPLRVGAATVQNLKVRYIPAVSRAGGTGPARLRLAAGVAAYIAVRTRAAANAI